MITTLIKGIDYNCIKYCKPNKICLLISKMIRISELPLDLESLHNKYLPVIKEKEDSIDMIENL